MKKPNLVFHNKLLLRTPLFPFVDFGGESQQLTSRPEFEEALYLASPNLHRKVYLEADSKDDKLDAALYKYSARITSRCTPFGLFAGVNLLQWASQTQVQLKASPEFTRDTTLDMLFLCQLSQHLEAHPLVRPHLRYFPNSSLYEDQGEYRYAEYFYRDDQRTHVISSVPAESYIRAILKRCENGACLEDLVQLLLPEGFTREEIVPFLHQIIDAQVLVSELEPSITGEDYLGELLAVLNRLGDITEDNLARLRTILLECRELILTMDQVALNPVRVYEHVFERLHQLQLPIKKGKLFQVNTYKKTVSGEERLSTDWQAELLACISFLDRFRREESSALDQFIDKFYRRYEDKEVPLLKVLDPDLGLGYPIQDLRRDITPLIRDLDPRHAATQSEEGTSIHTADAQLSRILMAALVAGEEEVDLAQHEQQFPAPTQLSRAIPPSLYCMFSVLSEDRVLLQSCGGVSANSLAARFARKGDELHQTLQELSRHDQQMLADYDICEILHLPESRTGNILKHPPIWQHEIPYLARSLSEGGTVAKVSLKDLRVSVHPARRQIFLRNAKTGRYVIPRLSHAHNFRLSNQPVYRFLCELQYQNFQPWFGIELGKLLPLFAYLPRVRYGKVVLEPASWMLGSRELKPLKNLKTEAAGWYPKFRTWQERYHLSDRFRVNEGDNYLLFDAREPESVRQFLAFLSNKPQLNIQEWLFDPETCPIRDENDQAYYNEVLSFVMNQETVVQSVPQRSEQNDNLQRYYALGDEWLYYKLYTGTRSGDLLLAEKVQPLVAQLQQQGLIDEWFFIRYNDPDFHLRIRFKLSLPAALSAVIGQMNATFEQLIQEDVLARYQTDLYKREVERYGGEKAMALSERFFSVDSDAVVALLRLVHLHQDENLRWQAGLALVDQLVERAGLSLAERKNLFENLKDGYSREFGVDSASRKKLEAQYKQQLPRIEGVLLDPRGDESLEELFSLLQKRDTDLRNLFTQLEAVCSPDEIRSLLPSYIHMTLNRLFVSSPRLHELVMYYFLARHYNKVFHSQKHPQTI